MICRDAASGHDHTGTWPLQNKVKRGILSLIHCSGMRDMGRKWGKYTVGHGWVWVGRKIRLAPRQLHMGAIRLSRVNTAGWAERILREPS